MTDSGVISAVDARMYVVLSNEEKHFFFYGELCGTTERMTL